jgi:endonuclease/exonuclease/phosphatase family metal-dependent hydrolase
VLLWSSASRTKPKPAFDTFVIIPVFAIATTSFRFKGVGVPYNINRATRVWFAGVAAVLGVAQPAAAQIKIVAYNVLHSPNSPNSPNDPNWIQQLTNYGSVAWHDGYYGVNNYGTIPQRPTIMALTECNTSLQGEPDSVINVKTMLNSIYGAQGAIYESTQIHAGGFEDYAFVYDTTKVQLLDTLEVAAGYRPVQRGHFRPVGYTSANSDFYVYNTHLKAFPGEEQTRASEVGAMLFRAAGAADDLPADANIIYVGDFNFTTSGGEPGYDLLLNPNPGLPNTGVAFDPLAGLSNPAYGGSAPSAYSTYSSTGPWSRIDFQFPSTELGNGEGLDYIDSFNGRDSLHAHGNRNGSTSGYQAVRAASDHLPVIADYQLPAWQQASVGTAPGSVIVGANASLSVTVENIAPAVVPAGADELDYSIGGGGVVIGTASGSDLALGGGQTHAIHLNTSTAGNHSGQVHVTSTSPAVENGSFSQPVQLTVLDHSEGSFAAVTDTNLLTLDLGSFAPGTSAPSASFAIHNLLATAGYTAALQIDSIIGSGDTSLLGTDLAATSIAAGTSAAFDAWLETSLGQGFFAANYLIGVSDEDLLGATSGDNLLLELVGYVGIDGDVNLDGAVDSADLNLLLSHYGSSGAEWGQGDLNGDQAVNSGDLNLLLSNYGTQAGFAAASLPVPEPASLSLLALAALACCATQRKR